jgi:hypothetical protein
VKIVSSGVIWYLRRNTGVIWSFWGRWKKKGIQLHSWKIFRKSLKEGYPLYSIRRKKMQGKGVLPAVYIEELELREQEMEKKTEKQDLPYAQENKGQERNNQRGSR